MAGMEHMDIAYVMDGCLTDVTNRVFEYRAAHSKRYAELSEEARALDEGLEGVRKTFRDRYEAYEGALCERERAVVRYYWSSGVYAAVSGEPVESAMVQITWPDHNWRLPDLDDFARVRRHIRLAMDGLRRVVSKRESRLLKRHEATDEALGENMACYALLHGYEWGTVLLESIDMDPPDRSGVEGIYGELP